MSIMLNSINCFRHKTRLISSSVAVVISIAVATFATYSPSASTASYDAISSLPDLGGSSSKYLSPSQAKLMGKAYIRQARRSIKFINDPLILNYINTLGQKIAKTNPDTTIDFEFYVVANPQFNAFAVPSGQIVVHSGLLESTESEGELAAVLAHEIAHVTQNHIARRLELSRYDNLFALAAVFAAAASGDSDSMQAAVMAGQGSAISRHLRYSRGFEREADALGIRSLALAGYEPHAAVSVLHKLRHAGKFNSTQAFEFLLSHPLTDSRISNLTQRSKTLIAFTNQALKENSPLLTYAEFKARVNALYGEDRLGTASRLEAKLADSSTPTLLYQYAVNQQRNQQFDEVVDSLRLANNQSPEKFIYQLALAEALVRFLYSKLYVTNILSNPMFTSCYRARLLKLSNYILPMYHALSITICVAILSLPLNKLITL